MKNPWTKKNPLMSLWLSGANQVAGAARGRATAAAKREVSRAATQATAAAQQQVVDFWTAALGGAVRKKRVKRQR